MTDKRGDFDSPWKQVLEDYFSDFIAFFFPNIYGDIDWTLGYEFLDGELQKVVRDADVGKRYADKLVKVRKTGGEEFWILTHIEIQQSRETYFAERMFVYNYRLRDRYNHPVVSLAVLTDESTSWRPQEFKSEMWDCETRFRFPIAKLIDYKQQWQALENDLNPFSTVTMAHLKAMETRHDQNQRQDWKFFLTRRLYEKGYERQDILNLFRIIDWIIQLPQDLEIRFRQNLEDYEREREMPYVTSIEKLAKQEGRQEGLREGILSGIKLGLMLKFGESGLSLLPEIEAIASIEMLQNIQTQMVTIKSPEELQKIYEV